VVTEKKIVKRTISISFVFAAVAVMLSASIMPHHHHGTVACVAHHMCVSGGCDDNHHSHESDDAEHSGGCVAETPFVDRVEREDKGFDCDSSDCGRDGHNHIFAIATLYFELSLDEPAVPIDYGDYIIPDYSVDARTGGGLRAPPASFC
jgi:hypothetical protein